MFSRLQSNAWVLRASAGILVGSVGSRDEKRTRRRAIHMDLSLLLPIDLDRDGAILYGFA